MPFHSIIEIDVGVGVLAGRNESQFLTEKLWNKLADGWKGNSKK